MPLPRGTERYRLPDAVIEEIQHRHLAGESIKNLAETFCIARNTVRKYVRIVEAPCVTKKMQAPVGGEVV